MVAPRKSVWVDTLHAVSVANGGQVLVSLTGSLTATTTRMGGITLIRTIICHDYSYTIHDSGEGGQILDIGVGVASQEAFASGIVPDPNVATDFPQRGWVYRCRHKLHGFDADQAAVDVRSVFRDIRSKRKIENGELYIIFDNASASGASAAVEIIGITRCLFLLS